MKTHKLPYTYYSVKCKKIGSRPHLNVIHASQLYENFIILFEPSLRILQYNIQTNEWKILMESNPVLERHDFSVVKFRDTFLIYGGQLIYNDYTALYFNDVIEFGFHRKYLMVHDILKTPPRANHSSITYKDEMIVFGGTSEFENASNDVFSLNLNTLTWKKIHCYGKLPAARSHHTCHLFGNEMIIFGGRNEDEQVFHDLWSLNLQTFQWRRLSINQSIPSIYHSSFVCENKMYIYGNENFKESQYSLFEYDIQSNFWRKVKLEGEIPDGNNVVEFFDGNAIVFVPKTGTDFERSFEIYKIQMENEIIKKFGRMKMLNDPKKYFGDIIFILSA